MEYEFRVYAINEAGVGRVSRPSESVLCCDPVDPPEDVQVTNVGSNFVTLIWNKPEYDGGSNVTGYIVEKSESLSGNWQRCNFSNLMKTAYKVDGLTEGLEYEFRVSAKNMIGKLLDNFIYT